MPTVNEWLEKAEGDLDTAESELERGANYDAVCYHLQQMLEKYLKSILVKHNVTVPKTHDLVRLARLTRHSGFEPRMLELESLTDFATRVRYPGMRAQREDAETFMRLAVEVKVEALSFFLQLAP